MYIQNFHRSPCPICFEQITDEQIVKGEYVKTVDKTRIIHLECEPVYLEQLRALA